MNDAALCILTSQFFIIVVIVVWLQPRRKFISPALIGLQVWLYLAEYPRNAVCFFASGLKDVWEKLWKSQESPKVFKNNDVPRIYEFFSLYIRETERARTNFWQLKSLFWVSGCRPVSPRLFKGSGSIGRPKNTRPTSPLWLCDRRGTASHRYLTQSE